MHLSVLLWSTRRHLEIGLAAERSRELKVGICGVKQNNKMYEEHRERSLCSIRGLFCKKEHAAVRNYKRARRSCEPSSVPTQADVVALLVCDGRGAKGNRFSLEARRP